MIAQGLLAAGIAGLIVLTLSRRVRASPDAPDASDGPGNGGNSDQNPGLHPDGLSVRGVEVFFRGSIVALLKTTSVDVVGLHARLGPMLKALSDYWQTTAQSVPMITSGWRPTDIGSRHSQGKAVDIRTKRNLNHGHPDAEKAFEEIREILKADSQKWNILLEDFSRENEHIHIAWEGE